MDVVKLFTHLCDEQRHNLNRAFRALFNFYEVVCVGKGFPGSLRKVELTEVVRFDLKVPSRR